MTEFSLMFVLIFEEPWIEGGRLRVGDADAVCVLVEWVEEIVEGVGEDGGWDAGEGGTLRLEPGVT